MQDRDERCCVSSPAPLKCMSKSSHFVPGHANPTILQHRAKRYERMMKAHGIHQPVSARDPAIPVSRRKEEFISQPAKKRKQDQFDDSHNQAADDDEGLCSVKSEIGCAISEHTTVKNEPALLEDTSAATEYPWLYYNQSDRASLALVDENATFNDFIDSGAYESVDSQAAFVIDPEVERKDNVNEDLGVSDGDIDQQSILILD